MASWWQGRGAWGQDLLGYLALALLSALSKMAADWQGVSNGPGMLQLMAVIVGPLPLLLRRHHPASALMAATAATIGASAVGLDTSIEITTLVIVLVSTIAAEGWLRPVPVFIVVSVAVNAALMIESTQADRPVDLGTSLFATIGTALAIKLGVHLRRYRDTLAQLSIRNHELDRLRVAEAQTAVASERVRIAREMHDVVAHHVSAILVRSRAAEHVMARHPDEAAKALSYAASAASETLTALGRLVGVLRDPETTTTTGVNDHSECVPVEPPQPTLDDVSGLVERANHSGQRVHWVVRGTPIRVTAGVALTVFRVIQECLTNALRHAPDADVELVMDWTTHGQLHLVVRNPTGHQQPPSGVGHGLAGMRERVTLCGGTLRVSPHGGEWVVRAAIPVPSPIDCHDTGANK